jgi:lipopolysaccharide transport system ATP-binding protein
MSSKSSKAGSISVRGIGKSYALGGVTQQHTTVAEMLIHRLKHPFQKVEQKTFWALQNISFEIQRGDVVGIIGRNGAGKSTLLKILSRITAPTVGEVDLHGRVGSLLEVGTGFHPELTGRENIYLNGQILGMRRKEIDKHFDAIVDFAEVEKFLDTPVKRYSSGMYVRLAFGVAAHLNPEILIVDEVLSVGDAMFQKKCLGKMKDVARSEGRTVIFVSHDMGAVRSLCKSAIWIDKSQTVMMGTANDCVNAYMQSTLEDVTTTVDLRDRPRPEIFGRHMKILGAEFNHGAPVFHNEPLTVRIWYQTTAEVHGVSIGFGLCRLEGARIISMDTDLQNERLELPANESGFVEMQMDRLYLAPGRYLLDIGARTGDTQALDYLGSVCQIEVLPGPTTRSLVMGRDGSVRMPATWTWNRNVTAEQRMAEPSLT